MSDSRTAARELAAALRVLHQRLLHATQRSFEKLHGRVGSAGELLQLVVHDPLFAWLRPMSERIVALDELVGDDGATDTDFRQAHAVVAELLDEDSAFRASYLVYLQSEPDAVLAHATVRRRLGRFSKTRAEPTDR